MGTNYYHYDRPPCPSCHRPYESKHIGKASGGWCFGLHVEPDEGLHDLSDWVERLQDGIIKDEEGKELTLSEMYDIITKRKAIGEYPTLAWCKENNFEPGPNGLVRHRVDGRHCIGHGDGTWDLITGEFS